MVVFFSPEHCFIIKSLPCFWQMTNQMSRRNLAIWRPCYLDIAIYFHKLKLFNTDEKPSAQRLPPLIVTFCGLRSV